MTVSVSADPFCDLIRAGKFDDAKRQYPDQAQDASKLLSALKEIDGDKGVKTLADLQKNPSMLCSNVIDNRLAGYSFLTGKIRTTKLFATDGYTRRLLMASGQLAPETATPIPKQFDQLAKDLGGKDSLWLMLDKAEYLVSVNKEKDAAKILKAISNRDKGEQVPAALYMQIKLAIQNKKSDEALRLLGIMQEAYPDAVGLDAITGELADLSDDSPGASAEAEQLTKTVYSVQMGVFASKINAQALVKQLDSYKQKVEIVPKAVSGKDYFVVFVGRFNRYDDAAALKAKLEAGRKETYQVIAR